jgi:nucleoside-diphosphate-sugar epimerase
MSKLSVIVLGGTGLVGSAICARLARDGHEVLAVNTKNYDRAVGKSADLLVNCNGNSYRYKAAQDPRWDFEASVSSVERSIFDFERSRYIYFSTIDVYNDIGDPNRNHERAEINPRELHPYAFHKWLAERLVEKFCQNHLILRCGTVLGPGLKKGPLFDLLHNEPLHMALDSELSLIDTDTIADAIVAFAGGSSASNAREIINLTGAGPASLRELCAEAGLSGRLAPGAEKVTYRYNINNARLAEHIRVMDSKSIGVRFLENTLKHRS